MIDNENMQKMNLVLKLLVIVILFHSTPALAQEAVPPVIYNELQRQKYIDEALKNRDPATLTPEEVQQLLLQSTQAGGVPQNGGMLEREWGYIFATGLNGSVQGGVMPGEYEVTMEPLKNVDVVIPQRFIVSGATQEITIGMQEKKGDGRLRYGTRLINQLFENFYIVSQKAAGKIISLWERANEWAISQLSPEPIVKQNVAGVHSGPRLPLVVSLYLDQNGNGQKDSGEQPVQWANVKLNLTRTKRMTRELQLTSGENELRFSKIPLNIKTAADLLFQATIVAPQEATLSEAGNSGKSVSLIDGKIYGEDNTIKKNTSYILLLKEPSTLTVVE